MINLSTILNAVQDITLVGVLLILVWLARKDYPARAVRALKRKVCGEFASPSAAHPAARAVTVRGWGRLSDEEALEWDGITSLLKAGVLADDPQSSAPRSDT